MIPRVPLAGLVTSAVLAAVLLVAAVLVAAEVVGGAVWRESSPAIPLPRTRGMVAVNATAFDYAHAIGLKYMPIGARETAYTPSDSAHPPQALAGDHGISEGDCLALLNHRGDIDRGAARLIARALAPDPRSDIASQMPSPRPSKVEPNA